MPTIKRPGGSGIPREDLRAAIGNSIEPGRVSLERDLIESLAGMDVLIELIPEGLCRKTLLDFCFDAKKIVKRKGW